MPAFYSGGWRQKWRHCPAVGLSLLRQHLAVGRLFIECIVFFLGRVRATLVACSFVPGGAWPLAPS